MIRMVEIVNYRNEILKIDLFNPKMSALDIRKIDGLGPVKADITTTKLVVSDGNYYNSARANDRNIILTLGFNIVPELGINSIEDCRQMVYKYFPLKKKLKISIITDNRSLYTYGYVESNEPDIFSQDETTQISLICPDSWMRTNDDYEIKIKNIKSLFQFPFEVLEEDKAPIDIYTPGGDKSLNVVREFKENNIIFYGNDVFSLYNSKILYSDLDFIKYRNLNNLTYKELETLTRNSEII